MAVYHIKNADLLAIAVGGAIFGVGMVIYGFCPGTALAAIGAGSVHALVGAAGMIVGGIIYALNFAWVKANILPVWAYGKARLPDITGIPDLAWFASLHRSGRHRHADPESGAGALTGLPSTKLTNARRPSPARASLCHGGVRPVCRRA